ncbi:hypothetical protein PMAYCL1PPCAC_03426, partial [Pristionchus mayeri]
LFSHHRPINHTHYNRKQGDALVTARSASCLPLPAGSLRRSRDFRREAGRLPISAQKYHESIFDRSRLLCPDYGNRPYLHCIIADVELLAQHEYAALERCLYYYLAGEAAKSAAHTGIPHPIAALAPNFNSREPVLINFHQVVLQHFELNEFLRDISIHGYIEIGWKDARLAWNSEQWKADTLRVQAASHIWVPVFTQQNYDTALRNGDGFELRRIETSSRGNVSAILAFSLRTFCDDTDFANYPDDTYKCCFSLEAQMNQEVIDFTTDNLPVFTDPKYFREYGWKVSGTVPKVVQDPAQEPEVGFCINLTRASSSVKIELTVPLIACALLFLLSPFFGTIRTQIFFKLFIVCMQLLTLLLFSNRIAAHLGSAQSTPRLLRFLEFAIIINVLSVAASVFLYACGRIRRTLPPWALLIKISSIVNNVVCVLHASPDEEEAMEKGNAAGGNFQKDWTAAFTAIHAMTMVGISIIFLLGYIIML